MQLTKKEYSAKKGLRGFHDASGDDCAILKFSCPEVGIERQKAITFGKGSVERLGSGASPSLLIK